MYQMTNEKCQTSNVKWFFFVAASWLLAPGACFPADHKKNPPRSPFRGGFSFGRYLRYDWATGS
jgi:hypothetical protein